MSLATTVLNDYKMSYSDSKLDWAEHRRSRYGAFEAAKADTPNLVPAAIIESAKMAEDHAQYIPVIKTKDYTITTTRSCEVITNSNESALVALTWNTLRLGFHMVPSQFGNNYIGYFDDFKRKMDDIQKKLLITLDNGILTKLNASKSAVNNAEDNPYAITGDMMVVPNADKEYFFNELDAILAQNDLYDSPNIVASPRTQALLRQLGAQGTGNSENQAFQLNGQQFYFTNRLTPAAGYRDSMYVCAPGSIGFMSWIDPDSRMGLTANSGKEWSVESLPLLGIDAGLLYQEDCHDNSDEAGNGFEASKREAFTFSFDYATVVPYNSAPSTAPGTIFKAGILAS